MLILLIVAFVFRSVFGDRTYQYPITNACGIKPSLNSYAGSMEVESQGKHVTVFQSQTTFRWTFHLVDGKYVPVLLGNISMYFNLHSNDSKMSLIL